MIDISTSGSLHGLRVLDLSRILAGPYCAMMLGDLGAEVIKVESPQGDDSRMFGPFVNGDSAYYRLFNRNKYGVEINLKSSEGKQQILGLVRRADILIENFRPGVMEKFGLPASLLLEENPRLIVVSISGFGQEGPLSKAPAYDLIAQAMSGLMSITGPSGGPPTRTGVSLGDLIPGLYGALAAVSAVHERSLTGLGQHIDISMLDSLISVLESVGMRALHSDEEPVAAGNDHAMTAPFGTYKTSDGTIAIAVSNDRLFAKLAEALSHVEWLEDDRFNTYLERHPHRVELRAAIEQALCSLTTKEALEKLKLHGVPSSKILSVNQALAQEHVKERGVLQTETDGFVTLGSPIRLTGSVSPRPAPQLGEHNCRLETWLSEPVRTERKE